MLIEETFSDLKTKRTLMFHKIAELQLHGQLETENRPFHAAVFCCYGMSITRLSFIAHGVFCSYLAISWPKVV